MRLAKETEKNSVPACAPMSAPIRSASASNSRAVRFFVPRFSISAVRLASPASSRGSSCLPARDHDRADDLGEVTARQHVEAHPVPEFARLGQRRIEVSPPAAPRHPGPVRFRGKPRVLGRRRGGGRLPVIGADGRRDDRRFAFGCGVPVEQFDAGREQVLPRRLLQVVPGHAPVADPVLRQLPGVPHEGRVAREQVGLGPEPLERPQEGDLGRRLHPLQLLPGRSLVRHPGELLVHLLAQPGQGHLGRAVATTPVRPPDSSE